MAKPKNEQTVKPAARIAAILADHPDAIEFDLAGTPRRFLITPYGFRLARAKGVDVSDVFRGGTTLLEQLPLVVFVGLLPFDPELELEEVEAMLSLQATARLLEAVAPSMTEIAGLFSKFAAMAGLRGNAPGAPASP